MGSDQTAAIRPALREIHQAIANGESDAKNLCATFTVPEQPGVWVQALHGTINAAYPNPDEPLLFLEREGIQALPDLAVESWQPEQYATFTHGPCSVESRAEFIDRMLVALYALKSDDYDIDVEFEHIV
jgi:hypothetical protein